MKCSFTCYGHENITSKHKTTLEFTKDKELGLKGDCIIGVKADFSLPLLKKFIKSLGNNRKITIIIETINSGIDNNTIINNPNNEIIYNEKNNINNKNGIKKIKNNNKIIEKINAEVNPDFNSGKDMVIRKSDFIDVRTFAIKADKAAFEISRGIANFLAGKNNRIRVSLDAP